MNTPTPEDIALAEQIDERMGCLDIDLAARLIAAHCAPLREQIAALKKDLDELNTGKRVVLPKSPEHAKAMMLVAGCLTPTDQLRELAEIGRLAVEERRLFNDPRADIATSRRARLKMLDTIDAYFAKQP